MMLDLLAVGLYVFLCLMLIGGTIALIGVLRGYKEEVPVVEVPRIDGEPRIISMSIYASCSKCGHRASGVANMSETNETTMTCESCGTEHGYIIHDVVIFGR